MNFDRKGIHGRSNTIAGRGLVATSQPLAAQAGLRVLQAGGNAVDAAVAAAAVLCVVEPCSTGIGGDAFALIWHAREGRLYGLNASGPAPAALHAETLRASGCHAFPQSGGMTVTVPGSVGGWAAALARFGSRPLGQLLEPAIGYARHGFPVSERIARAWAASESKMSIHTESARVWLPHGRAPSAAEWFRNPDFAATLARLAEEGPSAFYKGPIADSIVATVQADGGCLTQADLAAYQPEWVTPISVPYRDGYVFHEIPPNGQGLTALLAFNILRGIDVRALGYGSADYYHTLIETIKLAFADAFAYIADPRHTAVPVTALLADTYTNTRRALLSPHESLFPVAGRPPTQGDTVYLTVADGEGNMVSWIQSLYMGFGSGLTAVGTGVQLQNRGANFSLEPGHPNEAAPGKRPYHTIIPGFITHEGHAWSSFGVMGGFMQPQGHVQVGLNLVDFGMTPQAALDAPRFNWQNGRCVALEPAIPAAVATELARRGHVLHEKPAAVHYGGGQVIVRQSRTGVLIGGSEPRKDGQAVGW